MNINDIYSYIQDKKNHNNCLAYLLNCYDRGMYDVDYNELFDTGKVEYESVSIELYKVDKRKNDGMLSFLTKDKNLYTIYIREDAGKEKITNSTIFYLAYIDLINLIEDKKSCELSNHEYVLSYWAGKTNDNNDYSNFKEENLEIKNKLINSSKKLKNHMASQRINENQSMFDLIYQFIDSIQDQYISNNQKIKSRKF